VHTKLDSSRIKATREALLRVTPELDDQRE
jgi:hypothetical protein